SAAAVRPRAAALAASACAGPGVVWYPTPRVDLLCGDGRGAVHRALVGAVLLQPARVLLSPTPVALGGCAPAGFALRPTPAATPDPFVLGRNADPLPYPRVWLRPTDGSRFAATVVLLPPTSDSAATDAYWR